MPAEADTRKGSDRPEVSESWFEGPRSYRVVLDGIRSDVETIDSFALKFSILTKSPLSKMKHIVRSMPTTIWTGGGRSRAENILALLEEAGGKGSIVEESAQGARGNQSKRGKGRMSCQWCGYPIKEGETRCDFCLTPVGEVQEPAFRERMIKAYRGIPPKRLMLYGALILATIIFIAISR